MIEITHELSEEVEFQILSRQDTLNPEEASRCAELRLKFSGKSQEVYEELAARGFNGDFVGDKRAELLDPMRWCVEYHTGYFLPEAEELQKKLIRKERAWNWDRAHPKRVF